MKKNITIIAVFLIILGLVAGFSFAEGTEDSEAAATTKPVANADFRRVTWGMSKYTVMAIEQIRPYTYFGTSLQYRTRIMELDMNLTYEFFHNELVEGTYAFNVDDLNAAEKVKEILMKKYGYTREDNNSPDTASVYKWTKFKTVITYKLMDNGQGSVTYTSRLFINQQLRQKEQELQRKQKVKEIMEFF